MNDGGTALAEAPGGGSLAGRRASHGRLQLVITTWLVGATALALAALGWPATTGGAPSTTAATSGPVARNRTTSVRQPTSIVSLGDSIASGEGTRYGWKFDVATGTWTGPGDPKPTWYGRFQDCHQSTDAYGFVVARAYPGARFTELGCTGSTFDRGIAGPRSSNVPAQFGDWGRRTDLNATYAAADPDLVLVTFGADDVHFVHIFALCVATKLLHPLTTPECTKATPNGPDDVVKTDFTDQLPAYEAHLRTLLGWVQARRTSLGRRQPPVRIVVTTYPDPLPTNAPAGATSLCPDTWLLTNDQVTYLSSLVHVLDNDIVSTVTRYAKAHPGLHVAVANLDNAYNGHQWCSRANGHYVAPWAYGLSIYRNFGDLLDPNPAPFHPTPDGQRRIAGTVLQAIRRLYS